MPDSTPLAGRRERKKLQMREQIAETARLLFVEQGFENVPVAEIARVADVAEQTVYNHFPTKEDLVYWRMESFEDELLAAVRDRAAGESVLSAFGRFIGKPRGLLDPDKAGASEHLAALTRMIVESPALLLRERSIFAGYTQTLAELIAEQTGADAEDPQPWIAANALLGVHRAVLDFTRRRVLEGSRPPELTTEVRAQVSRALELLEQGMAGYAIKKAP